MTRQEAITEIIVAWEMRDQEFCCGHKEWKESEKQMYECLHALGVTDEEIRGESCQVSVS